MRHLRRAQGLIGTISAQSIDIIDDKPNLSHRQVFAATRLYQYKTLRTFELWRRLNRPLSSRKLMNYRHNRSSLNRFDPNQFPEAKEALK